MSCGAFSPVTMVSMLLPSRLARLIQSLLAPPVQYILPFTRSSALPTAPVGPVVSVVTELPLNFMLDTRPLPNSVRYILPADLSRLR